MKFFGQQIHLTKTADELLFKGYDDPIIRVAKDIAKIMSIDVPFTRFGWFYMVKIIKILFRINLKIKINAAQRIELTDWQF